MRTVFLILISLISSVTLAQRFHNLDFEQACDTSKTGFCNWQLSWGKSSMDITEVNRSLLIPGESEASVGFVEQSAELPEAESIRILELSGRIRSEDVIGKGAGLNLSILDRAGNFIGSKDMGYASFNWVKGTTSWQYYSISVVCPRDAYQVKIGAILYGKGKAWFDDYNVKLTSVQGRKPSALALSYITAVCDTVAMHSLMRDSVDLNEIKSTALQIAGPAETYEDCYLAVEYILRSLKDGHSFFMTAKEVKAWENDSENSDIKFAQYRIIDGCGYILVPPFHGGNKMQMAAYADSLQHAIQKLYSSGIKGWIVDLRENTGGNMGPMVTGLGPLLDPGPLGYLVDVNGEREAWSYDNGKYKWDAEISMSISAIPPLERRLPIAVLIGPRTGSSGEITVISFIGNSKTKTFGKPTWGLTTGNGGFDLPDGARIMLASTIMSDRNGNLFHGPISPDETIEPSKEKDTAIPRVVEWILNYDKEK